MKASAAKFLTLINGPKQFEIPIYQRNYSWTVAQCGQLFNDILRTKKNPNSAGHFIGSIVYFQPGINTQSDVPKLLVIDGQQRLTTISLLIEAIASFLQESGYKIEGTSETKLRNYYLFNAEEEGDLRSKLLLTRKDKDTLKAILNGTPAPEHPAQRILDNLAFFKDRIDESNVSDLYSGIQRLIVVDVALERDIDNPQLIFESLNSTGLDLSQADLIRNYVLMGQPVRKQSELYEKYWFPMEQAYGNDYSAKFDWFARDFLSVKTGRIPVIGRVYEDFKTFAQSEDVDSMDSLLEEFYKYSGYYTNIALHKEPDADICAAFRSISKLRIDVSYPFILAVYDDYANGLLEKNDFIRILNLVENYVFRRAICGVRTNSLNKTFGTLYKSVVKDTYVESVEAAFQLMTGYQRFPSDSEFENELLTKDVYNLRARNYMLSKLENYQRRELVNVDEYTIEHVMPQNPKLRSEWKEMLGDNWITLQEKYLHTLGNLTLTMYNPELSDRPFAEKKSQQGGFDTSPLALNEYLRTIDRWSENEIIERATQLAIKARDVWFGPSIDPATLENYRPVDIEDGVGTFEGMDNHEYLEEDMRDVYQSLRQRLLNIDASVRETFWKKKVSYAGLDRFVDLIPYRSKLKLTLNIPYEKLVDPKEVSRDINGIGSWGVGQAEIAVSQIEEIDYAMDLIQQAYDAQFINDGIPD